MTAQLLTLASEVHAPVVEPTSADGVFSLLWLVIGFQLLLALVSNGLAVLSNYVTVRLDLGMTLDFRAAMFQHVQQLSLAYHDQRRSGMLLYAVNSMDSAPTQLLMTLLPLAQNILTLVGMLLIINTIDPTLALLSLTVVPVLLATVRTIA